MRVIRHFLKPEWRRLFLFTIFLAIAVGGMIQAWAFSDVPPKPLLYGLLRPFPIWPLWMLLLLPIALVSRPLGLVGIDVMGGPPGLFLTANLVYFYLLSCLMIVALDWAKAKWKSQRECKE
ncbi:hypothetical protein ACFLT5_02455 [Chloroflexota bacterium]